MSPDNINKQQEDITPGKWLIGKHLLDGSEVLRIIIYLQYISKLQEWQRVSWRWVMSSLVYEDVLINFFKVPVVGECHHITFGKYSEITQILPLVVPIPRQFIFVGSGRPSYGCGSCQQILGLCGHDS